MMEMENLLTGGKNAIPFVKLEEFFREYLN